MFSIEAVRPAVMGKLFSKLFSKSSHTGLAGGGGVQDARYYDVGDVRYHVQGTTFNLPTYSKLNRP